MNGAAAPEWPLTAVTLRRASLTAGCGAKVVFDPVGGTLFQETQRCTAAQGRILVIGFAAGPIPQIPANLLLIKTIEVIGFKFGLYLGWAPVDERTRHAPRLRPMRTHLFEEALAHSLAQAFHRRRCAGAGL